MANCAAFGPMTATLLTDGGIERQRPSLTSSTVNNRRPAGHRPASRVVRLRFVACHDATPPKTPTWPMSRNTWRTWPSTTDSSTSPAPAPPPDSVGPSQAEGPGISRSSPASAAGTGVVCAEPVRHHQPVEAPVPTQARRR